MVVKPKHLYKTLVSTASLASQWLSNTRIVGIFNVIKTKNSSYFTKVENIPNFQHPFLIFAGEHNFHPVDNN